MENPSKAIWIKSATVKAIYDGDTIIVDIDLYDHIWKRNEVIRLYGINSNEIKRSRSHNRGDHHVNIGFQQRDCLIAALGLNPDNFPQKVKYHWLEEPVPIIIETIKDKTGKFGRYLGIIYKDGVNVNEIMRDCIGGVEMYDGKIYPKNHPIKSPY